MLHTLIIRIDIEKLLLLRIKLLFKSYFAQMELSLETLSLKQLQEKCKALELKHYGTKATMIQRIKDYEAKLKEIEIDRAMELEAALTALIYQQNKSSTSFLEQVLSQQEKFLVFYAYINKRP